MINKEQFEEICKKYGLDIKKLIRNNENVIEKAEYANICYVLDYLIYTLKITPNNIEKCPSILYLNIRVIKENWRFLNEQKIHMNDVETCLHILSTKPKQLKETYKYVSDENRYGKKYIEQTTSILRVPVERIQKIEGRCPELTKNNVISAAISRKSLQEIEEIIRVCKENKIEITGSMFRKTAQEIEEIIRVCQENGIKATGTVFKSKAQEIEKVIRVCKENGIEATGTVFLRTAQEIQEIIKICQENEIEITGSVFKKSVQEIEEIIKVCQENGIEITGSVFTKNSKQLKANIEFIKQNYGEEYLTPLIISKNLKNLQKILPYLQSIGVLEIVKNSASILSLTLEEIQERQSFIERIGEQIVKNGRFNSIFGMSRKKYQKKVKEFTERQKLVGEIKEAIQEGKDLDKQISDRKKERNNGR